MKKRILVIALSALVIAGAIGGAGAALAMSSGDKVDDNVAEQLGVTAPEFENAVNAADQEATDRALSRYIGGFVAKGIITEKQATELRSWISAEPEITFTYKDTLFGFSDSYGFAGLDEIAAKLGKETEELRQAYDDAFTELSTEKDAEEKLAPKQYLLQFVDRNAALGQTSESDAVAVRNWVNQIPDWFNDNNLAGRFLFGGAGAALATSSGVNVDDNVAERLGVTPAEFGNAVKAANREASNRALSGYIGKFVAKGIITEEQATELQSWISAESEITFTYNSTSFGFGNSYGFAELGEIAAKLGKEAEELSQAYKNAFTELFREEEERLAPKQYLLRSVDRTAALGQISESDAATVRNWINRTPSWFNDNDLVDRIFFGRSGFGYYGKEDYQWDFSGDFEESLKRDGESSEESNDRDNDTSAAA